MEREVVNLLVGMVGISVILTILVQLGKELLPSREDADGSEIGPRRWLAPIILVLGAILGAIVGVVRKDYIGEDAALYMTAWVIVGFIIAAASVGLYGGLSSLLPSIFNSQGWLGRGGG